MSILIYHNPRWGKSRNSVRILQEKRMSQIESKKESNELITKKISANNVPDSNNKRTEPEAKLPKDI